MQIRVVNLLPALCDLFTEKARAKDLLPQYLARAEVDPGMRRIRELGARGFQDLDILSAAGVDGLQILEGQQQWGLFNPTRNIEATKWCFDEAERVGLDELVREQLREFAERLPAHMLPEKLEIFLFPPDCANAGLMRKSAGLSCYGRVPGTLLVRVWPSQGNLKRLGPALARSFAHGVRRQQCPAVAAVSLREALVMEGMAASFVQSMFPKEPWPWLSSWLPAADWEAELTRVAGFYGEERYEELTVNIYGSRIKAGEMRLPEAVPLSAEELEYATELILSQAACSDANVVAAHLYGDCCVAMQGHPTFGVPHLAGFEVGYRAVQAAGFDFSKQAGLCEFNVVNGWKKMLD